MPRTSDDARVRWTEGSRPRTVLVGLWLTALALTLLGAGSVVDVVVHDRTLGARETTVTLANALLRTAEITRAQRLSEAAREVVEAVKPDVVWLRADDPAPMALAEPPPSLPAVAPPAPTNDAVMPAALISDDVEPTRVLLIGASSIQLHFGVELERTLRSSYRGVVVKRVGKLATGLVRPDYFDWPKRTGELLSEFRPHLVVAQFGGNDVQGIAVPRGTPLSFGTPEWDEEFGARVTGLVELVHSHGAQMVLLDMPMMQDPKFSEHIQHVNEIMEARAREAGSGFISTWRLSADPLGNYTNAIVLDGAKWLLRSTDGVHFTHEGAIYMAQKVAERLERERRLVPVDDGAIVVRRDLTSKALGRDVSYLAYVPPSAARGGEIVPSLFLLHGVGGTSTDWADHAHEQLRELSRRYGLVFVTPEGGPEGWYVDVPAAPNRRYETHVVDEVIADVKASLPVDDRRGIAGVSSGGHGAITLALKHPGLFASASAMSGVVDLPAAEGRNRALVDALGPYAANPALWEANSAIHLVRRHPDVARELPMLLTVGVSDRWLAENRAFSEELTSLGVVHAFEEREGSNDWPTWTRQLARHAAWHAKRLRSMTPTAR